MGDGQRTKGSEGPEKMLARGREAWLLVVDVASLAGLGINAKRIQDQHLNKEGHEVMQTAEETRNRAALCVMLATVHEQTLAGTSHAPYSRPPLLRVGRAAPKVVALEGLDRAICAKRAVQKHVTVIYLRKPCIQPLWVCYFFCLEPEWRLA